MMHNIWNRAQEPTNCRMWTLFFLVGIKACQNDNLLVPLFVYEEQTNSEKIFKIGLVIQQNLQHPLVDKTSNILYVKNQEFY